MLLGINNKDELLEDAFKAAESSPRVYQKSVEYYYFTRYFVSVFEAYHYELPIQIWNEYRNALDHFFRHLSNVGLTPEEQDEQKGSHKSNQLKAMEAHLIRAALDMLKIIAVKGDDWYQETLKSHPEEMLVLVDDGNFLSKTKNKYAEAIRLTVVAKTKDQHLGTSVQKNDKAIRAYLDAAFAYNELREMFDNNIENISKARINYKSISDDAEAKTHKKSFVPNVFAGIVATVICTVVLTVISMDWWKDDATITEPESKPKQIDVLPISIPNENNTSIDKHSVKETVAIEKKDRSQ